MDIYGNALKDFYTNGTTETLWLHNSYDEPEEMPIDIFFRNPDEMPDLEIEAIKNCKGNILDVGAGVGSHALFLQQLGKEVTAIDISSGAVELMKLRGVKKAIKQDIFTLNNKYDTLLFLMNGIGLTGTLAGFTNFLTFAKSLLNPNGQLLFDSSDIAYLYEGKEKPLNQYYGEVNYCYEYKNVKGNWFNWLYIDQKTLKNIATQLGWQCEIIYDDGEDQYLARLKL